MLHSSTRIQNQNEESQTFQKIPGSPPPPPRSMAAASAASRAIFCELSPQRSPARSPKEPQTAITRRRPADPPAEGRKIVLQPRLCTLRSYGDGAIRQAARVSEGGYASTFFGSLADYIESSRKSQDFEIVSGRLAMIAFAAAVSVEFVTEDSLFKKLELQQITGAAGLCAAVGALAAIFAWFSSAKTRIGQMFNLSCNKFVDTLIDNLVDGLFYESELGDWSDGATPSELSLWFKWDACTDTYTS